MSPSEAAQPESPKKGRKCDGCHVAPTRVIIYPYVHGDIIYELLFNDSLKGLRQEVMTQLLV